MATTNTTIEVTLIKAHTHRGKDCAPGEKIQVSRQAGEFLLRHKKIDKLPGAAKA